MKLEYAVRIERLAEGDGGGYLATVPDLPGCMSDGETPEEALKNVQEAIVSWIEAAKEWKLDVPQPSLPLRSGAVSRHGGLVARDLLQLFDLRQEGLFASHRAARRVRAPQRQRCADDLPLQHRRRATYLLRHLRHSPVLRAALGSR